MFLFRTVKFQSNPAAPKKNLLGIFADLRYSALTVLKEICHHCAGTGEEPDFKAFGAEMRAKREKRGILLRTMAERMCLSESYVSDLELGKRNWTAVRIAAYEQALRIK